MAERGADIVVVDLDADAAERTATFVRHHGVSASVHAVDVSDAAAMEGLVKDVLAQHGAPDVVVNNAGIGMVGEFLATSVADWERILGVNVWGVIHGSRLFAQAMVDAGRPGHVVNLSSGLAYLPVKEMSAYATTKAAVLMLSEVLRNEFADHGIGVSAICPGVVDTGITDRTAFVDAADGDDQDRRRAAASHLYQRRRYGPGGVARAILSAIEDDRAIVPVTIESQVGRLVSRLAPGLNRRLAATDLVPH
jgi:NAD(P)-dependent dehydrogenase (short-subunit alcohol dehydrogenase family)